MMEFCNVSVGYGRREVLKNISLRFENGKISAVIGPNGCGKSTLLKGASGLLPPLRGRILLDGTDIHTLRRNEFAKKVSLLPQTRPLGAVTVQSMVMHGRFPYLGFPRSPAPEDEKIVLEAMRQTGVLDLRDRNLEELSGGERQKVYLAMLIAQDADVVLLDEPTTYLDIRYQFEVLSFLKKLRGDHKAVVAVMHDLTQAFSISDRMCLMEGGSVAAWGTPEEIYESREADRVFSVNSRKLRADGQEFVYFTPDVRSPV